MSATTVSSWYPDIAVFIFPGVAHSRGRNKRGPASKLEQQLERITQLPNAQQKFVSQMLDTVLQQQTADH